MLLLGQHNQDEEIDEMGEPWPISIPGIEKPIRSDKIKQYFDSAFWFYEDFYMKTKHCANGNYNPQKPWTEWPEWIPQLITEFDNAVEQIRNYNIAKNSRM